MENKNLQRYVRLYNATGDAGWIEAYAAEQEEEPEIKMPRIADFVSALKTIASGDKYPEVDDVSQELGMAMATAIADFISDNFEADAETVSAFNTPYLENPRVALSASILSLATEDFSTVVGNLVKSNKARAVSKNKKQIANLFQYVIAKAYLATYGRWLVNNPVYILFAKPNEVPMSLSPKLAARRNIRYSRSKDISTLKAPTLDNWRETLEINATRALAHLRNLDMGLYNFQLSPKQRDAVVYNYFFNKGDAQFATKFMGSIQDYLDKNPERKGLTVQGAPLKPDMHIADMVFPDRYTEEEAEKAGPEKTGKPKYLYNGFSFFNIQPGLFVDMPLVNYDGKRSAESLKRFGMFTDEFVSDFIPAVAKNKDAAVDAHKDAMSGFEAILGMGAASKPLLNFKIDKSGAMVSKGMVESALVKTLGLTTDEAQKTYEEYYAQTIAHLDAALTEIKANNLNHDQADKVFLKTLDDLYKKYTGAYSGDTRKVKTVEHILKYIAYDNLCVPVGMKSAFEKLDLQNYILDYAPKKREENPEVVAIIKAAIGGNNRSATSLYHKEFKDFETAVNKYAASDAASKAPDQFKNAIETIVNNSFKQFLNTLSVKVKVEEDKAKLPAAIMATYNSFAKTVLGVSLADVSTENSKEIIDNLRHHIGQAKMLRAAQDLYGEVHSTDKRSGSTYLGVATDADPDMKKMLVGNNTVVALQRLKNPYFLEKYAKNEAEANSWMDKYNQTAKTSDSSELVRSHIENSVVKIKDSGFRSKIGLPIFEPTMNAESDEGYEEAIDWLDKVRKFLTAVNSFDKLADTLGDPQLIDPFFVQLGREVAVAFGPRIAMSVANVFIKATGEAKEVENEGKISYQADKITRFTAKDVLKSAHPAAREAQMFLDNQMSEVSYNGKGVLHTYSMAGIIRDIFVFEEKARTSQNEEDRAKYAKLLDQYLKPVEKNKTKTKGNLPLTGYILGRVKDSFGKSIDNRNRGQLQTILALNRLVKKGPQNLKEFAKEVGAFADPIYTIRPMFGKFIMRQFHDKNMGRKAEYDTPSLHMGRAYSAVGQLKEEYNFVFHAYQQYFERRRKEILQISPEFSKFIIPFSGTGLFDASPFTEPGVVQEMEKIYASIQGKDNTTDAEDKLEYNPAGDVEFLSSFAIGSNNDLVDMFGKIPASYLDSFISSKLAIIAKNIVRSDKTAYKNPVKFINMVYAAATTDRNFIQDKVNMESLKEQLDIIASNIKMADAAKPAVQNRFMISESEVLNANAKILLNSSDDILDYPIPTGHDKEFSIHASEIVIDKIDAWMKRFEEMYGADVITARDEVFAIIKKEYPSITTIDDVLKDPDVNEILTDAMNEADLDESLFSAVEKSFFNRMYDTVYSVARQLSIQRVQFVKALDLLKKMSVEDNWSSVVEQAKSSFRTEAKAVMENPAIGAAAETAQKAVEQDQGQETPDDSEDDEDFDVIEQIKDIGTAMVEGATEQAFTGFTETPAQINAALANIAAVGQFAQDIESEIIKDHVDLAKVMTDLEALEDLISSKDKDAIILFQKDSLVDFLPTWAGLGINVDNLRSQLVAAEEVAADESMEDEVVLPEEIDKATPLAPVEEHTATDVEVSANVAQQVRRILDTATAQGSESFNFDWMNDVAAALRNAAPSGSDLQDAFNNLPVIATVLSKDQSENPAIYKIISDNAAMRFFNGMYGLVDGSMTNKEIIDFIMSDGADSLTSLADDAFAVNNGEATQVGTPEPTQVNTPRLENPITKKPSVKMPAPGEENLEQFATELFDIFDEDFLKVHPDIEIFVPNIDRVISALRSGQEIKDFDAAHDLANMLAIAISQPTSKTVEYVFSNAGTAEVLNLVNKALGIGLTETDNEDDIPMASEEDVSVLPEEDDLPVIPGVPVDDVASETISTTADFDILARELTELAGSELIEQLPSSVATNMMNFAGELSQLSTEQVVNHQSESKVWHEMYGVVHEKDLKKIQYWFSPVGIEQLRDWIVEAVSTIEPEVGEPDTADRVSTDPSAFNPSKLIASMEQMARLPAISSLVAEKTNIKNMLARLHAVHSIKSMPAYYRYRDIVADIIKFPTSGKIQNIFSSSVYPHIVNLFTEAFGK